jgi:hypothetical protein
MYNYNYKSQTISHLIKSSLGILDKNDESGSIFDTFSYLSIGCLYYNIDESFNVYGYVFFYFSFYGVIVVVYPLILFVIQKVRKRDYLTLPLFFSAFSYNLFKSFIINCFSIPINFIYNDDFTKKYLKLDLTQKITWLNFLFVLPILFLLLFPSFFIYKQKIKKDENSVIPVYIKIISGEKDKPFSLFFKELFLFLVIVGQIFLNFFNQIILNSNSFNLVMLLYLFFIHIAKLITIYLFNPYYYKWFNQVYFLLNLTVVVTLVMGIVQTILNQNQSKGDELTISILYFIQVLTFISALLISLIYLFRRGKYKID